MRPALTFTFALLAGVAAIAALAPEPASALQRGRFGALAVDRSGQFAWGTSYDYGTRAEARARALAECGGNCRVVLEFVGGGCGAYHAADGPDGAWGWATAAVRSEAQERAEYECRSRSEGEACDNFAWACNSDDGTEVEMVGTPG